ncbi:Imm52 family immunity protein [Massilia sp. CT11-137]|uniref:Imm52 family immunity protein n=1 Tax=Massilia sp. CT11-137 TaxID=3393901 RepID=UPI0039AFA0EF
MSYNLTISCNFRTGSVLPSIESQYTDLWKLAVTLQSLGFPLDEWYPPADTQEQALLNSAFTDTGPSMAALAMAKADKDNLATDLRSLGVWNGKEGDEGATYTTSYDTGRIPSRLRFRTRNVGALQDYRNVIQLTRNVVGIWKPMLVQVGPADYSDNSVFPDRPGAGWMLYLPFAINAHQVPEAADVIKIMDDKGKAQQGSLIITVAETFDVQNPEHIKKANAIETRLVDQDLLPTNREFVTKF